MIAENILQSVFHYLFSEEEINVFAVLDGASVQDLLPKLDDYQPDCYCLFPGELEPDMAEVAPYLVWLKPDSEFTDWVIKQGWGKHWGIFAISRGDILAMRRHFRSLVIVSDSKHNSMYFRFYDPRVMRLYLPTCNGEELAIVFGPVDGYILEDEDPSRALRFRTASGSLLQEKLQLSV